ncbi:D-mannose binding lectin family protein [Thioploca ingrica]|uniref:D-mannose binding lectin family protein n=1 Tax=Thioploca ingrica TaxID=40754 RepID=A0A090AHU8_9GAMM|nr:D-mannose binding lectin family protein [Thioploca ingrica]
MKKVLTLSLLLLLFSVTNTVLAVDTLRPGEWLVKGQSLSSNNGYYSFIMQSDGNLVLYVGSRPLWSSGTYGQQVTGAVMQTDGNLVIYSPQWRALWNSGTWGNSGSYLVLQNDGNAVIYKPNCPLWSTKTNYP